MKKIAAFIFTLGLSASYAIASDIDCYSCEEELRECKMMYGDRSPFCIVHSRHSSSQAEQPISEAMA